MSKFLSINKNQTGRDFVCSDIHGHFFLLDEKLAQVNFDIENDRLFCLGDLIDRSDDSVKVLGYLKKPWFYSILGNHEIMLIDAVECDSQGTKQQWYFWGGDWAEDIDDEELVVYYNELVKLPVAIELEIDSDKRIGLVHANLPAQVDWNDIKSKLDQLPEKGFNTHDALLWELMWSKAPIETPQIMKPASNINHVFHGHTIVDQITAMANRSYIDLGSYESFKLGFVQPDEYLETLNWKPGRKIPHDWFKP